MASPLLTTITHRSFSEDSQIKMFQNMKNVKNRIFRPKYYLNFVEASYLMRFVKQVFGISVYTIRSAKGGKLSAQFTFLGLISFVIWYSIYFYCVYQIYVSDQTILRSLYNTKLQRYGDEVERISTTIFVIYAMWKLPFDVNANVQHIQLLVDIDKAIENLGEPINFRKSARSTATAAIAIICISLARMLITCLSLTNLKTGIPPEKIFQVVFTDALALTTSAHYCGYLYFLTDRYEILNKILNSIEVPINRNLVFTVREKNNERAYKTLQLQDKYTSEKLKSCGKIYGMLHNATEMSNKMFGLSIAVNMLLCLILIILYLFYFMEATASGLFHDLQRYADFLIYVFWQIGFAIGVISLNIYFSENTVREAKVTSFVIHNIINSEMNPLVRTEAVHLSLQVLHQLPVFTASGLCKIDYMLLLEGARTVVTFLVILLQFAADTHK